LSFDRDVYFVAMLLGVLQASVVDVRDALILRVTRSSTI
jgi:hypothetical protein